MKIAILATLASPQSKVRR
jgi:importin subunit beta-1